MGRKTPPYPNYPAWTTARFWSFIRSALRRAWTRYPPKYEVMNACKRPYVGTDKRRKFEYQCAACEQWFMQKQVEVDHLVEAGSLKSYEDLPGFVERLFTSPDKLQVLCKDCHKGKTYDSES